MTVDAIRYKRLGYVALNVTDLGRSRCFYEDIVGLTVDDEPEAGRVFLRCSDRHHDIVLEERGREPGIKRVAWEMEDASALDAARKHLLAIGRPIHELPEEECNALGIGPAFRSNDPSTGIVFEFYDQMRAAPAAYVPTHTLIARLGHIVVNSTDRPATEAFMLNELNFRASDRIDGMVTFLRCFPNPFHHSYGIGVTHGEVSHMNHLNFMVTEMADIGKATNRMKRHDVPIVYGIGKHPPSESVFLYFLDPDGLTVEYSFGMEEFPEHGAREPRDMPATLESVDYWGGAPDPRSGAKGAIETMS